jgi:kynurenine formamidase
MPLHEPDPHLAWRTPARHNFLYVGHEDRGLIAGGTDNPSSRFVDRDDYLDGLWLSAGTQWDGLAHLRHPEHGNYNGIADSDIRGGCGSKLGVDQWSRRAIVGRGVLVDLAGYASDARLDYDAMSAHAFTVEDLKGALERQAVALEDGDILLLHTGWLQRFRDGNRDQRERWIAWETIGVPGLEASTSMMGFLWDSHVAAVASDSVGVEAIGPNPQFTLHLALLTLLGIPLGNQWVLHELATDCTRDGRYAFLLVSVPLNVRGGIGSPAQAVAIK